MQWWDIYVQVPERLSATVGPYLHYLGSAGVVEHEATVLTPDADTWLESGQHAAGWTVLYGAWPEDTTLPVRLCALQEFLTTTLERAVPPRWKLACRFRRDQTYLLQWQQFHRPLEVANRLLIHPPWETSSVPTGMPTLVLDPGLAFGTGLHPTTRMCLSLLAQRITPQSTGRLLDVGCGSGILSLAALKLGARYAVGVDIEAQAVRVARHNAMLNDLQHLGAFLQGSITAISARFTWIAANVYLGPLVEMMPALARLLEPQGSLLVSGILAAQETALRAAIQAAGLLVRQRLLDDGWVTLEGCHVGAPVAP